MKQKHKNHQGNGARRGVMNALSALSAKPAQGEQHDTRSTPSFTVSPRFIDSRLKQFCTR
ncbi:MAG TPA: hypothetical protein VGN72_08475 [Tepidisphaeraceae bacterium]|jgi:hypothetical protein|nr:hypothetical protein [Tepidisphaeraceae bacterium]